jgi:deoxyribonuclease V
MRPRWHPCWDLSTRSARALQQELAPRVETADRFGELRTVAGLDVGLPGRSGGHAMARAAVVLLSLPGLDVLEEVVVETPVRFPYVPGLLSFREIPPLLAALEQLRGQADLLMCDGQGIAHPRRFGLACHLGLLLDCPAIGVAKTRLCGDHGTVGRERGERTALVHDGEVVGTVLRTRTGVKPLFISPGHRVSIDSAARLTLDCHAGVRVPQPTRLADRLASRGGSR